MSNPNQNKPGGKPGQRGKKPDQPRGQKPAPPQSPKPEPPASLTPEQQQNPKPVQLQSPKPVQLQSPTPVQLQSPTPVQVQSPTPVQLQSPTPVQVQSPTPVQLQSPKPVQLQSPKPAQQPDGKKHFDATLASANTLAIDFQAIATAYSDYSRKSFEQTRAFLEKLSGVRSLDKAIEIQTEFAKQVYETFVTESQKIRELYSGVAKQTFKPCEGLVAKPMPGAR
jgi:hypothetical protein